MTKYEYSVHYKLVSRIQRTMDRMVFNRVSAFTVFAFVNGSFQNTIIIFSGVCCFLVSISSSFKEFTIEI